MSERPLLIVKTGEALAPVKARYGDFEEWIARGLGVPVAALVVASVHLGEVLPDAAEVGGVVVTGSPAMVTERPDWSEAAAAWLADVVRADALPVLGLCYGHQLVAHGLGGEVGPNPKGREMGTVEVTFADAPAAGSIFERGAFPGHMSHVESVLRPPADARVLAQSPIDPYSVLAFGPRQWGVQFHPEFDAAIMRGYVEARREVLLDEGLDPDAMIAGVVETPALTRVLARFAEVAQRA
jgi:GMP synthase (glutamine-hydrolysing)